MFILKVIIQGDFKVVSSVDILYQGISFIIPTKWTLLISTNML